MEYNVNHTPDDNSCQEPVNNKQRNKRERTGDNSFWRGLFTGILASLLIASCAYTVKQVYTIYRFKEDSKALEEQIEEPEEIVTDQSMGKIRTIEEVIRQYYYKDDVETKDMINGMYEGIVASLEDPYSVYYTTEELQKLMEQTEGIYFGIGAQIHADINTGLSTIVGVFENTPAEAVGLRDGDIIYKVDDKSMEGLDASEVVSYIKGAEGTTVHLTIYREGEKDYLEFDVTREKIENPTVNYEMLDNKIGYLQITEFDDITLDQFTEAMAVLQGQEMKGLILDLRSNPGGNLNTVTDIARQLLPEGLIVYTEDKEGNRTEFSCDGTKEFKLPLVVLVNQYSASASEILAGAIKDYGIGELVGKQTFGKGIVQRVLSLSDGTALKLTVSTYFTPNGNNIHGIGIEPDVECEFDGERYANEDYDTQLEKAKEIINEKLK